MEPDLTHRSPSQLLVVQRASNRDQGWGLFNGREHLPRHTILGEYFGKRLREQDIPSDTQYVFHTSKGRIDARLESRNRMRLINHRNGALANVMSREMKIDGRIFIITKRRIAPYEEIFLNYGAAYWWGGIK